MMRSFSLCLAAMLAAAAATPSLARPTSAERGEAELAKELSGLVQGAPQSCLSLSSITGSHIIDRTAIVYDTIGGKIYVNRPNGAEMMRDDDIPVQFVYGSQLCRLDRIKLLDRSSRMERGFANLGDFVVYTKPPKAKK